MINIVNFVEKKKKKLKRQISFTPMMINPLKYLRKRKNVTMQFSHSAVRVRGRALNEEDFAMQFSVRWRAMPSALQRCAATFFSARAFFFRPRMYELWRGGGRLSRVFGAPLDSPPPEADRFCRHRFLATRDKVHDAVISARAFLLFDLRSATRCLRPIFSFYFFFRIENRFVDSVLLVISIPLFLLIFYLFNLCFSFVIFVIFKKEQMLLLKVAVKSGIQKLPIKEKQVFLIKSENMVLSFFRQFLKYC